MNRKMTDEIIAFIVRRYAIYDSTTEIRKAVEEEFGVKLSSESVRRYNIDTQGVRSKVQKRWIDLFDETRDHFQKGLDDVGIVWKPYRLKRLDEMERVARAQGNYSLARELLEQAAKETGGMYDKGSPISLSLLQRQIDELARVVVEEVHDETILNRISERWSRT